MIPLALTNYPKALKRERWDYGRTNGPSRVLQIDQLAGFRAWVILQCSHILSRDKQAL